MGNEHSPGSRRTEKHQEVKRDRVERKIFDMDNDERREIARLKTMIRENPEVFILNNLLMSIRLFTHYETETQAAQRELERQEREFNEKLVPGKVVLIPDLVRQRVSGKVRFTSYQNDRTVVEPLKPTQVYVVYDNVFVQELNEPRVYSNPEDLRDQYTLALKESDLKGYARLELLNDPTSTDHSVPTKTQKTTTPPEPLYERINAESGDVVDGEIYPPRSQDSTDSSNLYEDQGSNESCDSRDVLTISQRIDRLQLGSSASSSSGYTTTTASSASLRSFLSSASKRSTEIPGKCFKKVTFTHDGQIYSSRRRRQQPVRNPSDRTLQQSIREAELYLNYNVVYLKSTKFAENFWKIFRDELGSIMELIRETDETKVFRSEIVNSSIRLEKVSIEQLRNYANVERHELTPCLRSPWPSSREWRTRSRKSWPSTEDRDYISGLQCHLVPESQYFAPGYSDPLVKLNWSLNFPVAERYLETRLSPAQMTVYALALAVHKNFFRSSNFGLTTSHVRHALFWLVEENPKWQERDMGKWVIELLKNLHGSVKSRAMSDYFVQERNILASVKQENLMHSQKQLKRIIDNPVMFLFHVLEKIEYEDRADYPRLDYSKLLKLLTENELVLKNPHLVAPTYERRETDRSVWEELRDASNYYTQIRRNCTLINPTQVNDSIIEIQVECSPLTQTRLSYLLNFFSEHFLAMAARCHDLGAAVQKNIYLRQTNLLALLLADDPEWESEARSLVDRVNYQRMKSVPPSTELPVPPETPRRNPSVPAFVVTENEEYACIDSRD